MGCQPVHSDCWLWLLTFLQARAMLLAGPAGVPMELVQLRARGTLQARWERSLAACTEGALRSCTLHVHMCLCPQMVQPLVAYGGAVLMPRSCLLRPSSSRHWK